MSDLETRQLRYFVAVAEELHFGRAADRLGMAQPPLSRAIRELERQLGAQLLERTTRQVALTPAGVVLLRDARTALDAINAADRRTRNAGRPTPTLRVALKADYDAGLLPKILSEYKNEQAALPVEVTLGGRGEQAPALRDGRADVALLPEPFVARGLDFEPLLTEPRLVALPADDPLIDKPDLRLSDLAGRVLADGSPADRPEPQQPPTSPNPDDPNEHIPAAAESAPTHASAPASFPEPPTPAPQAITLPSTKLDIAGILNLVELGGIVWFPPASAARRHPRPGIAYRPVADLALSTLAVAWPQDSRSPATAAFVRTAIAVAASFGPRIPQVG